MVILKYKVAFSSTRWQFLSTRWQFQVRGGNFYTSCSASISFAINQQHNDCHSAIHLRQSLWAFDWKEGSGNQPETTSPKKSKEGAILWKQIGTWQKWKNRSYPSKTDWRGAQTNLVLRVLPFINYQILSHLKIIMNCWSNINTHRNTIKIIGQKPTLKIHKVLSSSSSSSSWS